MALRSTKKLRTSWVPGFRVVAGLDACVCMTLMVGLAGGLVQSQFETSADVKKPHHGAYRLLQSATVPVLS